MGQKVHPHAYRLGPLYDWKSKWYADKDHYQDLALEDRKLRQFLSKKLELAGLTSVQIERSINTITIYLYVSRPGVVIGRGGANIEQIKNEILKLLKIKTKDRNATKVDLKVEEVKNPDLSARLIHNRIKDQLEKRYPHRRAASQAIEKVMASGAKGVKIIFSGRIGGAEIGRTEKYGQGSVPTQTIRADIDYYEAPALTRSGYVGIKVYIYKGEKDLN